MIQLTNEEVQFCEKHMELIRKIVRTASSSYISPEYREGLIAIGKKYKLMDCTVCNSSLYLSTCRLFHIYEEFRLENKPEQPIQKTTPEAQNVTVDVTKTESNINTNQEEKDAPKRKRKSTKK